MSALVFSPDGKKLVSGTMGGNIQMWDTETGIGLVSLTEQDPDDVKYGVKEAIDADPDATVVTTTSADATVVRTTTYREPIITLTFSPNGKVLAREVVSRFVSGTWEPAIGEKEFPQLTIVKIAEKSFTAPRH